jgi:pimeloyl-ACP methyl ester carboxylesterase
MNFKFHDTVYIKLDGTELSGELILPEKSESLVLFSHGSGSSRFSPRNNFVAKELHKKNTGTFLFDLLTEREDQVYANRFDIDLLTGRLIHVTKHVASQEEFSDLNLGYFGASTGAASALKAAAALPEMIQAIVSRGGRPDLAIPEIENVIAPTLLIVGSLDYEVIRLNRKAYDLMKCEKRIEKIEGATHLFEEPGTLLQAALAAAGWFTTYLAKTKSKTITAL